MRSSRGLHTNQRVKSRAFDEKVVFKLSKTTINTFKVFIALNDRSFLDLMHHQADYIESNEEMRLSKLGKQTNHVRYSLLCATDFV